MIKIIDYSVFLKSLCLIALSLFLLDIGTSGAEEWNTLIDNTRLTSNSTRSNCPSLGVDSFGNSHITWSAYRDGNEEIYYTKLNNDGKTLVEDTRLTSNGGASSYPRLKIDSSDNIHIIWQDNRDKNYEIYYTKLNPKGITVVDDIKLTDNNMLSVGADTAIDSFDNIHIVWIDERDGNKEIYYTKLNNNGETLVEDTRLTSNNSWSSDPSVGIDNSNQLHIAWVDRREDNITNEIYYTKLDNNGITLVDDIRLTHTNDHSSMPSLGVDSFGNIHIAWVDRRDGNGEIYYTKLDNNGSTIVEDTRLTSDSTDNARPSLRIDNKNNIHLVWEDLRDGNREIYYTKLDNNGETLVQDTKITSSGAYCYFPSLEIDSSDNIHVVWIDRRDGNNEIYYTKGKICTDADNDGYYAKAGCNSETDCDDMNSSTHPGAIELCDGKDNDCDGQVDENLGILSCGLGICRQTVDACLNGESQQCIPGNPGNEICNDEADNDCDGYIDEGCFPPEFYVSINYPDNPGEPISVCFILDPDQPITYEIIKEQGGGSIGEVSQTTEASFPSCSYPAFCVDYIPGGEDFNYDAMAELGISADPINPLVNGIHGTATARFAIDPYYEIATSFCTCNEDDDGGALMGNSCTDNINIDLEVSALDLSGSDDGTGTPLHDAQCVTVSIAQLTTDAPLPGNFPIPDAVRLLVFDVSLSNGASIAAGRTVTLTLSLQLPEGWTMMEFEENLQIHNYNDKVGAWKLVPHTFYWDESQTSGTAICEVSTLSTFVASSKQNPPLPLSGTGYSSNDNDTEAFTGTGCSLSQTDHSMSMGSAIINTLILFLPLLVIGIENKRRKRSNEN